MKKEIVYKEKEIVYEIIGDEVAYNYKDNPEVNSGAMKVLKPVEHREIIEIIKSKYKEFQEIEAKKRAEELKEKIQEFNTKRKLFYEQVSTLQCVKDSGFKIVEDFIPLNANFYNGEPRKFSFEGFNGSVEYDNEVYHSGSWSNSKTSRVWVVWFDYKKTRYSDLTKAVEKLIEKTKERIEQDNKERIEREKKNNEEQSMKMFCEKNGLEFKKEFRYSGYRNSTPWHSYSGKKDNIIFSLVYYENEVKVTTISIEKPSKETVKKMLEGKN